jgi:hypothetical protein
MGGLLRSHTGRSLSAQAARASFESDVKPLDRYFRNQAEQDAQQHPAPFVLVLD